MRVRSFASTVLISVGLLCTLQAQTKRATQPKPASSAIPEKTVDVIVHVDAYDWMDNGPIGDAFGRQFNTLIVRVETVVSGSVLDPWIRVDYYGSNRHHKEDLLPKEIFEPGHRWEMRLSPTPISDMSYLYCSPREAGTVQFRDGESGEVVDEVSAIRSVSEDVKDVPDISRLKCYALKREDIREVVDSD